MVVVGVELALQLRNARKMLRRFLRRLLLLRMLSVGGGVDFIELHGRARFDPETLGGFMGILRRKVNWTLGPIIFYA
jgi:hypothetical protein